VAIQTCEVLNMSRRIVFGRTACLTLAMMVLAVAAACSTVAISGRKQLNLVSDSELLAMSAQQYDTFLVEAKVSDDRAQTALVRRVGQNISAAVEQYFRDRGQSAELKDYDWQFNLVEDDQVNAWCMPGGRVVFYTGILPVCQDETGISVVMGHEVAHAVAKHGAERMSQGLLVQMGGMALSAAVQSKPAETQQLWMTAFAVGAQFGVMLPYSRTHESEADHLGLIFMSMAGYDPNQAVGFWQRMAANAGGAAPPEWMSTHPSDQTRINDLKAHLPEALGYYQKAPTKRP
jgi:predicted Zn-dependent protease